MENWDAIAAILSFLLSRNRIRRFIISNVLSRIDIWRIRAGVSLMKHREREFYDRGRSQVESRYVGRGQSNNGLPGKIITARRISSFWNIFLRKKKKNNNNNNNLSFTNFFFVRMLLCVEQIVGKTFIISSESTTFRSTLTIWPSTQCLYLGGYFN